ncbi:MAG: YabP/YqfC family sporulation protein [Eubacteriaceae bacterium]|nr:YabP/YqfC family sporulation protein [Eubacteriaceae bacterium]
MKNLFDRSKRFISENMNIPATVAFSHPMIEIDGRQRVRIESHKGIVKYSESEIIVNTLTGTVVISGDGMNIHSLLDDEMMIKGRIDGVRYIGE